MQAGLSEQVTFGGSGLDRAAERRTDPAILTDPAAQVILFWRGNALFDASGALVRLSPDHPVLAAPSVFLGLDGGVPVLVSDISDWEPEVPADQGPNFAWGQGTLPRHPDLPAEWRFDDLRRVMWDLTPRDAELSATARALLSWHDSHRFCAKCGAPSEMEQAGWTRRCPSCGAFHFPRTDPVVIMLITRGNKCLIGRSPGWPEGMYSMLAGFVEPGETIEAAVRREVLEESGIRVGAVRYVASQPWPFPNSLMFGCQGEALSEEIRIDPAEIEEALWVTREELAEAFAGNHPRIKSPRKGAIAEFVLRMWLADRLE